MSWRIPVLILVAIAVVGVGYVYLPYVGWSNSLTSFSGVGSAASA
jgi:hypothetical protein